MNWAAFFAVLAVIESLGNPNAVGDLGLRNRAYGRYQIRKPYVEDVNRWTGKRFTLEEVVVNDTISRWYIHEYVIHYAEHYGRELTYETAVRIHNGGPRGWEKESTVAHWEKFRLKWGAVFGKKL